MKRSLHSRKLRQNRCSLRHFVLQKGILSQKDLHLSIVVIQGNILVIVKRDLVRSDVKFADQPAQGLNCRKDAIV